MICGLLENLGSVTRKLRLIGVFFLGLLASTILFFLVGRAVHAQTETRWMTRSFQDFAQGELGAGGANLYVSRRGAIQMINMFDLNHDGHPDILFNQSHDFSTRVNAFIYWNTLTGFGQGHQSTVP